MKKRIILLLATCLLITSCLFGCGDDTKPSDDNPTTTTPKAETTTKEDVTTTEPTTEEPTTPEETTTKPVSVDNYEFKGQKFTVKMELKDFFNEMIIENGTKIYINDICSGIEIEDDILRGNIASKIAIIIWAENDAEKITAFDNKYIEPGLDLPEISLDKNAVIEYNEGCRWYFCYIGKNEKGLAVFDVYKID